MNLKKLFSRNIWKEKAKQKAKELNALKKRNKEIIESREEIKLKIEKYKKKNNELEKRNRELEIELKKN